MRARAASERANARTYAHTSVHLYAHVRSLVRSHVHSSVHSFALRSSPRPLATRTPYVHRVSWSFKSIVYEALKKAKKSSAKLLAPTDPILGPENLLKTSFAQKGLPSCPSGRHKPQSYKETKTLHFCNPDTKNLKNMNLKPRSQKWDRPGGPIFGTTCAA